MTFRCNNCGIDRPSTDYFYRSSGEMVRPCRHCKNARYRQLYSQEPKRREKAKALAVQWNRGNQEKRNTRLRKWYKANREHLSEYGKKWRASRIDVYRERACVMAARYKARKRGLPGTFSVEDWRKIVKNQNGKCAICGKRKPLSIDHIIPLSKQGSNWPHNIQGLCIICNIKKSNKIL